MSLAMSETGFHSIFEDVLEKVGGDGYFQKRFNILFNLILQVFISMANLNLFILMAIPEHWCYVPGRKNSNFSLEEWKSLTIPSTNGEGNNSLSSCQMFRRELNQVWINTNQNSTRRDIDDCQHGWEYDKTWYKTTIPSQEDWVCENEFIIATAFVFCKIGDIIGSFIFGQIGDILGRITVYYSTIVTILIGKILLIFTPAYMYIFMFAMFFCGLAMTSSFQPTLVIAMEITSEESHATIALLQCVAWTIAWCIMSMTMWVLKEWIPFLLITTLPCVIFLFMQNYLIESPRWLANKGKKASCLKELSKIASANGVKISNELDSLIDEACLHKEKTYGVISIFFHWRLIKNTFLIMYGLIITNISYYIITLNVMNMGGNPFMNFFWQGLAELPGYIFGQVLCNRIGRKLTALLGAIGMIFGSVVLIYTINNPACEMYSQFATVFLKLSICMHYYAVNLIALEMFPTPVRQSGCSLCYLIMNTFGLISPYVVYMGTLSHPSFPYIISAMLNVLGLLFCFFLPETLYEKLPETLPEAYSFGKNQPFWNIPRQQSHHALNGKV